MRTAGLIADDLILQWCVMVVSSEGPEGPPICLAVMADKKIVRRGGLGRHGRCFSEGHVYEIKALDKLYQFYNIGLTKFLSLD